MRLTGGQVVTKLLEELGAEHVFGMSGHTVLGVLDAIKDSTLSYVSVRHEQIASHAADAYFKSSHKPAVVLTHAGPGMTNAITGVVHAALDCTPMIVIAGDVPSQHIGDEAFQEITMHSDGAQWEIYRPFVKRAYRVNRLDSLAKTMVRAFAVAYSGRPGPVLVSVPMDFLSAEVEEHFPYLPTRRPATYRTQGDQAQVLAAVNLLAAAVRPTIFAGGGVIQAEACPQLVAVAEHFGALVATSASGKGAIPEDHPLAVGVTGVKANPVANDVTREADVLLAIGTRFGEQDSSSWHEKYTFDARATKIIQVDVDGAELGKLLPIEVGIVGDAAAVLDQMLELAGTVKPRVSQVSAHAQTVQDRRKSWLEELAVQASSEATPIAPSRILAELRLALPRDGILVTDVGWSKNGATQQFPVYEPMTHLGAGGLATMGWAGPAVLGAKLACPNRPVIGLLGDGAFSSMPQVIMTAVEYGVAGVWLIMNDYAYGAIKGMQDTYYGRDIGTDLISDHAGKDYLPDFAGYARAMGAEGVQITDPTLLGEAIGAALASARPYVIDVIMQRDVRVPTNGYWDIDELFPRTAGRLE